MIAIYNNIQITATTINVCPDDESGKTEKPGKGNSSPSSNKTDDKPPTVSSKPDKIPPTTSSKADVMTDDTTISSTTISSTADTNSKSGGGSNKGNNSTTPIFVGVIVGILVIGAIVVVWHVRRKKGENTNVEDAAEGRIYSQAPVNDPVSELDGGNKPVNDSEIPLNDGNT